MKKKKLTAGEKNMRINEQRFALIILYVMYWIVKKVLVEVSNLLCVHLYSI